jgi:hypothetical protein
MGLVRAGRVCIFLQSDGGSLKSQFIPYISFGAGVTPCIDTKAEDER